ncbi:glycosyltransferase [Nocardioides sp. zg-1308]|uniref:glycosyltransferase n=1 Tax=Nocardioides sp. zg-1308 TaxID=2736253 RepID=UPI001552F27C|nr:glycosyltransferase [Nocardioides sp. zg-1308]NPD03278.1 glycosyltransferase [Nocardioides sp. zg-1308]
MFSDLPEAPTDVADLWDSSMAERVGTMLDGERRVAFVYRTPDTSTFRYRVSNVVDALNHDPGGTVRAGWFCDDELRALTRLVPQLDLVVVARYPYGAALRELIQRAEKHGVPLVFDCDDLVFDVRFAELVMSSLGKDQDVNAEWDVWFAYMGRLNASLRACRGALTTNGTLADQLSAFVDDEVSIVPNVMNREQQAYSRAILEHKLASGWKRSGPVTIGYFSGTPSHVRDFSVASGALARLLDRDSDVAVRIVGYLDDLAELERHRDRVEFLPFMHYVALQRAIGEVEVNIAPLQHTPFNICKSDLKYFEAAAVGTWTVASHTPSLDDAIHDGTTGRLAKAHEWDAALAEAVDLARDTGRYAELGAAAAHAAHERWSWDSVTEPFHRALAPYVSAR